MTSLIVRDAIRGNILDQMDATRRRLDVLEKYPPVSAVDKTMYLAQNFGAVGDGETDDTAAIQAAINAAQSVPTGGVVLMPSTGTYYKTTSTLTITGNYVHLMGYGQAQIYLAGTGNILSIVQTGSAFASRNMVTDLYLGSNGSNAGYGIYLDRAVRTRVERCMVFGTQYSALYTTSSWWLYSHHNEYDGRYCDSGHAGVYHSTDANNMVHEADRFFGGTNRTGCIVEANSGIMFTGCDFSGAYGDSNTSTGLDVRKCLGLSVIGCYFESNTARHLYLNGTYGSGTPIGGVILGNYFESSYGTNVIGIDIQCAMKITISGNYLLGGNGATQTGINVGQKGYISDIYILNDNFIYGFGSGGTARRVVDNNGAAHNYFMHKLIWASALPANGHFYEAGTVIFNSAPGSGEPVGWIVVSAGCACTGVWTTGQTYTVTAGTEKFYASSASRIYRLATSPGTAVSVEPTHTTLGTPVDPGDGYTWEYIQGSAYQWTVRAWGQVYYRSGSATPVGSVTPYFIGEEYLDTTANVWYKAYGSANTTWAALN